VDRTQITNLGMSEAKGPPPPMKDRVLVAANDDDAKKCDASHHVVLRRQKLLPTIQNSPRVHQTPLQSPGAAASSLAERSGWPLQHTQSQSLILHVTTTIATRELELL